MTDQHKLSVYIDRNGEWRWRIMTHEGRVTANSSQSFRNKNECMEDANYQGFDADTAEEEALQPPLSYF